MTGNKRNTLIVMAVSLSVALVFALTLYLELDHTREAEKRKAYEKFVGVKSNIERSVRSRVMSAQSIMSYIWTKGDFTEATHNAYAEGLFDYQDNMVLTAGLIKDTSLKYIYPPQAKDGAEGLDLAAIESQKDDIIAVKESGKGSITGPVDLAQGGTGIIVRIPIFSQNQSTGMDEYWGQETMVFDMDKLVASSGLSSLGKAYNVELRSVSDTEGLQETIWSSDETSGPDAVIGSIDLGISEWEMSISKRAGWRSLSSSFWMIAILGVLTTAGSGYGMSRLMGSKQELEDKVTERTAELITTNTYLEQSMAELEESHSELENLNDQLNYSLDELKRTQNQLITSEKLAALGELVAGVAHEINTPLGIGVTLSSYIQEAHDDMSRQFESGKLSRSQMKAYIANVSEALTLLNSNLERSSDLVVSFKQVAADQATSEKRTFNLHDFAVDVIRSIRPNFKNTPFILELECDDGIVITSYPGAISQILTNFIMNSLIHGFSGRDEGRMLVSFRKSGNTIILTYIDDGNGISEENSAKVFNPFFTTRKNQGSTGLGLHIVHNIVTQTLKGSISLESSRGNGVVFTVEFEDKNY